MKLTEVKEYYYDDEEMQLERHYFENLDSKKHGLYLEYFEYEDGQLCLICNYVDGELHGKHKTYYANAQLKSIGNYVKGERHGEYKWYYDNGQLGHLCTFAIGLEHGEYIHYRENGQLHFSCTYVNGKRHGEIKYYNESDSTFMMNLIKGMIE